MAKYRFLFLFPLVLMALSACKSDNCEEEIKVSVIKAEGPSTVKINKQITYKVTFGVDNLCGDFGYFQKTESGNTYSFAVYARYLGCTCTQTYNIVETDLRFVTPDTGTYYFRFEQDSGKYVVDTLRVTL